MEPMEQIYQQYAAMVYRYLLGLTRDADLAEDAHLAMLAK